ncbi:sensor histidine kinase [Bacillus sp. HMF5848]|uniref:sensor histidine kinase n=1 Tax=Bacillus sp. HMF5848 TaxID=2495421 RepID=UPI000F7A24D1|nr:HAMP domain-containing sensor histidine kinase [Bacillus sp. HMF5848]RSK26786.1 sensor histidine kinase [Bacillus sp. HMF5848]
MKHNISMKWKINGQLMFALIITIIFSFICFVLLYSFLVYKNFNDNKLSETASEFVLSFDENILWNGTNISLENEAFQELNRRGLWLQVLDEYGSELFSTHKPTQAPSHYTPGQLLFTHKYSDVIKGYTIYGGISKREEREFTYIIGFPSSEVSKYVISYNPNTFVGDILRLAVTTLTIVIVTFSLIGYFLSVRLTKPVLKIIEAIKELSKGKYVKSLPDKGLYNDVYDSLENLSNALQANELEREKLDRLREEWIANISHDLKTPLSSVKGYAELLTDGTYIQTNEEKEKYANVIQIKAQYMEQLIEDLKLTYQLKSATVPIKKAQEDFVGVVRETVIQILNDPDFSDANLQLHSENKQIVMFCNKGLIERAIMNLVLNAIVHNPKDTLVTIHISEKNRCIVAEINDNGQGISEEEINKLFERYYRGTNTRVKGTGLGMAIAKQVVEAHNGEISVTSKLQEGTTVTITIPRSV